MSSLHRLCGTVRSQPGGLICLEYQNSYPRVSFASWVLADTGGKGVRAA